MIHDVVRTLLSQHITDISPFASRQYLTLAEDNTRSAPAQRR